MQLARILPEVILTIAGVLVMLVDPLLPRTANRKSVGWFSVLAMIAAFAASAWQLHLAARHRVLRRRADRCLQRLLSSRSSAARFLLLCSPRSIQ